MEQHRVSTRVRELQVQSLLKARKAYVFRPLKLLSEELLKGRGEDEDEEVELEVDEGGVVELDELDSGVEVGTLVGVDDGG